MRKVSVIIPTYNRGDYICEALDSVFAQTFQDFEVIVVDDGSTDGTRQKIKRYMPRIKYIYQENAGVSAARNKGIAVSKGRYLAFLDSDDLWVRDKLKLQVEFMDSNPGFGMVCCDICMLKRDQIVYPSAFQKKRFMASGYIFGNLIRENFISTPTVMVRREVFNNIGMFDELLPVAEDYDMWLRIAREYLIGVMDTCLVRCRMHDANISWAKIMMYPDMHIKALKKHEKIRYSDNEFVMKHIRERLSEEYYSRGYINFCQGNNKLARTDFLYSLRYGLLEIRTPFLLLLTVPSPYMTDKLRRLRRRVLHGMHLKTSGSLAGQGIT